MAGHQSAARFQLKIWSQRRGLTRFDISSKAADKPDRNFKLCVEAAMNVIHFVRVMCWIWVVLWSLSMCKLIHYNATHIIQQSISVLNFWLFIAAVVALFTL